jgi:hypothetical protein
MGRCTSSSKLCTQQDCLWDALYDSLSFLACSSHQCLVLHSGSLQSSETTFCSIAANDAISIEAATVVVMMEETCA